RVLERFEVVAHVGDDRVDEIAGRAPGNVGRLGADSRGHRGLSGPRLARYRRVSPDVNGLTDGDGVALGSWLSALVRSAVKSAAGRIFRVGLAPVAGRRCPTERPPRYIDA